MRRWGWLVLIGLALLTQARVVVWQSEIALWEEAARRSPQKPRVQLNLGRAYALVGRNDDALQAFARAKVVSADPRRTEAEWRNGPNFADVNTALLQLALGQYDEAKRRLREVVTRAPTFQPALIACQQAAC